jgi:hypothetical protein
MTATPPIVDRETWQKQIDTQRVREKAHTREGPRSPRLARPLPVIEVDPTPPVVGAAGDVPLIDTFQEPVAAVCVGARRRVLLRTAPTLLENDLRQVAEESGYRDGFIAHYLVKVIYLPGSLRGCNRTGRLAPAGGDR